MDPFLDWKYFPHNLFGFKLIENTIIEFDKNTGFVTYSAVIQRETDGKYFRGEHTYLGNNKYEWEEEWWEVIPMEVPQTIFVQTFQEW